MKNQTAQGLCKRPPQHFPKREIRREGRLRGLRYAMTLRSEKSCEKVMKLTKNWTPDMAPRQRHAGTFAALREGKKGMNK